MNEQGDPSLLELRGWSTETYMLPHRPQPRSSLCTWGRCRQKEALPFTKAQAPPGANHSLGRRQKLWFPWQRRQRPLSTAISWSRDVDCTPPHPDGALLSFSHQEGTDPILLVQSPTPNHASAGRGRDVDGLLLGALGQQLRPAQSVGIRCHQVCASQLGRGPVYIDVRLSHVPLRGSASCRSRRA